MQKFYEYYEEIYSEKDQKFIEETGRGKIMYKISNFSDNDDVKIIDKSGPFEVIEYQRDLSVMPEDAQLATQDIAQIVLTIVSSRFFNRDEP